MDQLTSEFQREKIKRSILEIENVKQLRAICIALMECNSSLRSMLLEKMKVELPRLDSTGL